MRPTCTYCARKHLAQALILMHEARQGYPEHRWLAIGHMAEAADELLGEYPATADQIRAERKKYEADPAQTVDVMHLIKEVGALAPQVVKGPQDSILRTPQGGAFQIQGPQPNPHVYTPPEHPNYETITDAKDRRTSLEITYGPFAVDGWTVVDFNDHTGHGFMITKTLPGGAFHKIAVRPKTTPQKLQESVNDMFKIVGSPAPDLSGMQAAVAAMFPKPTEDRPSSKALHAAYASTRKRPVVPNMGMVPAPSGSCPPCIKAYDDSVYALLTNALNDGRTYAATTVILTTLSNFHPSYSLASVIIEQAHAAAMLRHRVLLVVHRGCDVTHLPPLPPEIILAPLMPVVTWRDDVIDEGIVTEIRNALMRLLGELPGGPSFIITHDLMFQAAYVSAAKAIHQVAEYPSRRTWYHMAHSSVGERPENKSVTYDQQGQPLSAEPLPVWYRCTIPPGHHLLVLNHSDVPHFRDYYRTGIMMNVLNVVAMREDHIHTLLNSRDIRPFLRMTDTAAMLTTRYGLHLADVCVMFPVSFTRIRDKRVDKIIQLLGVMKRMGLTVRLLIPTAHANGDGFVTGVAWIKEHATAAGLMMAPDVEEIQRPLTGISAVDLANQTSYSERAPLGGPIPDLGEMVAEAQSVPEVILTCSILPETRTHGLDADTIRSLWGVTNVFMLPSISEAGSLILLEAALAGCSLVLNGSLPALHDYIPLNQAIWIPWGSVKGPGEELTEDALRQHAENIWSSVQWNLRREIMQKHSIEVHAVRLDEILNPEKTEADYGSAPRMITPKGHGLGEE